jgi:ABC-type Fe3+-siderophore transport system permease subunit
LIALPCLLFITGALVAALGYFPKARAVSLDDMTALEAERNRNIRRRRSHAWVAMTLWAAGMVAGAVLLVGLMA